MSSKHSYVNRRLSWLVAIGFICALILTQQPASAGGRRHRCGGSASSAFDSPHYVYYTVTSEAPQQLVTFDNVIKLIEIFQNGSGKIKSPVTGNGSSSDPEIAAALKRLEAGQEDIRGRLINAAGVQQSLGENAVSKDLQNEKVFQKLVDIEDKIIKVLEKNVAGTIPRASNSAAAQEAVPKQAAPKQAPPKQAVPTPQAPAPSKETPDKNNGKKTSGSEKTAGNQRDKHLQGFYSAANSTSQHDNGSENSRNPRHLIEASWHKHR